MTQSQLGNHNCFHAHLLMSASTAEKRKMIWTFGLMQQKMFLSPHLKAPRLVSPYIEREREQFAPLLCELFIICGNFLLSGEVFLEKMQRDHGAREMPKHGLSSEMIVHDLTPLITREFELLRLTLRIRRYYDTKVTHCSLLPLSSSRMVAGDPGDVVRFSALFTR